MRGRVARPLLSSHAQFTEVSPGKRIYALEEEKTRGYRVCGDLNFFSRHVSSRSAKSRNERGSREAARVDEISRYTMKVARACLAPLGHPCFRATRFRARHPAGSYL